MALIHPRLRLRRDLLIVVATALGVRVALVGWGHARFPPADDGSYYDVLARRLAAGEGYTWLWPDGAVTYAAHYPVGYPAVLAVAYRVFGASWGVAMAVNALLGAVAAWAAFALVDAALAMRPAGSANWRPSLAGLVVGLHPALVPYTLAIMTEGFTAALLLVAAAFASQSRSARRAWPWVFASGVVMGLATLVRPQSLALAPVLGALAFAPDGDAGPGAAPWRARAARAGVVLGVALACVAPWTARNCIRMHRCALVSVNGGWNLLIGTQSRTGAYERLEVPPECRTVWDEAGKDTCFERAARAAIASSPGSWLALVPAKLAMTFDYFGAAPRYLHESNPAAFDEDAKWWLQRIETLASRLLLLGGLVACGRLAGARATARKVTALASAVAGVTWGYGWIGYIGLVACVALLGPRGWRDSPLLVPWTAGAIAATAAVHAIFFGAGRYGLVVAPLIAAMAFVPAASLSPPRSS
jgi:4-amino-4-deoxy-L-arabinose transferase-like glycosyltransferase